MHIAQETYAADEDEVIEAIVSHLQQKVLQEAASKPLQRENHTKMYGLVKAEFIVEDNLPPELAVGIFRQAHTYPAWIRFSNQYGGNQADIERDMRGMSIKLMQVKGKKLCDPDHAVGADQEGSVHYTLTQDFLLINSPVFLTKNPAQYLGLLQALSGSLWHKLRFFCSHWRLVWNWLNAAVSIANPLQTRYYSSVPFLLGRRAVKYAAIPIVTAPDLIPSEPDDDYLRAVMQAQLKRGDAYFNFCVQLQSNEEDTPIENPQIKWSERRAPFHKVASIRILKQNFDQAANDQLGESLSFDPWRSLAEHRPLGGINRARREVYRRLCQFRRARRHHPSNEPAGWDLPE